MLLNKYFASVEAKNTIKEDNISPIVQEDFMMDGDSPDELHKLELQLVQLKLQETQLKLKELKKAKEKEAQSGRKVFRDSDRQVRGDQIVVRNDRQRSTTSERHELDYSDDDDSASLKCVSCNKPDCIMFCGRCGVTPYCCDQCQKNDWSIRHRSHCHNLICLSVNENADEGVNVPSLRRPHNLSSGANTEGQTNNRNESQRTNERYQRRNDGYQRNNDGPQRNNDRFQRDGGDRNERSNFNQRSNQRGGGKPQDTNNFRPAVKAQDEEEWPSPAQEKSNLATASSVSATPPQPARNATATTASSVSATPPQPVRNATAITASSVSATPPQPVRNATATTSAESTNVGVATQKDIKVNKPPLVPEKCLIDELSVGNTVMVSVLEGDNKAQVICLSLSTAYADGYQKLCEDYTTYCEEKAKEYVPNPGDTFSVLDSDGYWYRARCLDGAKAALIDAGRMLDFKGLKTKELGAEYIDIVEYCCVMDAEGQCNPGDCFTCVVKSQDESGRVTVSRLLEGAQMTDAVLTRWTPPVTYKTVTENVPATRPAVQISRPPLPNKTIVSLVHVVSRDRVVVRQAQERDLQRDDILEAEVTHYGLTAKPLATPPTQGDIVITKSSDNMFYRAMVKRTNVKQNKYLLEYIELGKEEIATLERLYPCPFDMHLSNRACYATIVSLADVGFTLTEPALEYLNQLKDKEEVLVVSTPTDQPSVPSGSPITLLVHSSGANVNRRVEEMCKPDWKKVEEKGGDVFDTKLCMLESMTYLPLPKSGSVSILDSSAVESGVLAVCPADCGEYINRLLGPVTTTMSEYCNSKIGSEPYMPRLNELCIAKFPPHEGWFRAVMIEQIGGAGGDTAMVLYLDYGNIGKVTSRDIRKMMHEYVDQLPALASSVEIKDFPTHLTPEMISKTRAYLKIPTEDTVGGVLTYTAIEELEPGNFSATAPALLAAITG